MQHAQEQDDAFRKNARAYLVTGIVSLVLTTVFLTGYVLWEMDFGTPKDADDFLLCAILILNPVTAFCLMLAGQEMSRAAASRLKAQREAERERLRLEAIMEQMPVGVAVHASTVHDIVLANSSYYDLFQIEHKPAVAAKSHGHLKVFTLHGDLYPPERWPSWRALATGKPVLNEELFIERMDGKRIYLLVNAVPIVDLTDEASVVVTCCDITDRKIAEENNNKLLRRVLSAQEEERLRIARELHDQIGQDLTALSIGLKTLESSTDAVQADRIKGLRQTVGMMNDDVRHLTASLRPLTLSDLGLGHALEDLVNDWGKRLGIRVGTDLRALDIELSEMARIVIYRVVQEAITNIAKHAHASTLRVAARSFNSMLRIVVIDDGAGFDAGPLQNAPGKCFGLAGMTERLSMIGGHLRIESHIGKGTQVVASVPLKMVLNDDKTNDVSVVDC